MTPEQRAHYQRLAGDGRWGEAFLWKEARRHQLRDNGLPREEAQTQAWAEMVERYPPAGPVVAAAGNGDEHGSPAADPSQVPADASETAGVTGDEPEVVCEYPTPSGSGGDFAGDVRWVYENYSRVVIHTPGKPARCDFTRATRLPPSGGAVALMGWASENRTAFFKDLVPKTLGTEKIGEEKEFKEDQLHVEKVREILKRFVKVSEEMAQKDETGARDEHLHRVPPADG